MSQSGILTRSGSGGTDILTITGNSGGPIGPDVGGNINVIGAGSVNIVGVAADNTLTVSVSGTGLTWHVQSTNVVMSANSGYITNSGSMLTLTLPLSVPFATIVQVAGKGAGGWTIAQQAGQTIYILGNTTTSGTGGSLSSNNAYDSVQLLCTDLANTGLTWIALIVAGDPNWT